MSTEETMLAVAAILAGYLLRRWLERRAEDRGELDLRKIVRKTSYDPKSVVVFIGGQEITGFSESDGLIEIPRKGADHDG